MPYRSSCVHSQQNQLESIREASFERKGHAKGEVKTTSPNPVNASANNPDWRTKCQTTKSVIGTCCDQSQCGASVDRLDYLLSPSKGIKQSSRGGVADSSAKDLSRFDGGCSEKHNENMYITRVKLNGNQHHLPRQQNITQTANRRPESSNFTTASFSNINSSNHTDGDCCMDSYSLNNNCKSRCTDERELSARFPHLPFSGGDKNICSAEASTALKPRHRSTTVSCCSCCSTVAVEGRLRRSSQPAAFVDSVSRDVRPENRKGFEIFIKQDSNSVQDLDDTFKHNNSPEYPLSPLQKYISTVDKKPAFVTLLEEQRRLQQQKKIYLESHDHSTTKDHQGLTLLSNSKSKIICKSLYDSSSSDDLKSSNSSDDGLKDIEQIIHKHLEFVGPPSNQEKSSTGNDFAWNHLDWRNVARRYSDMPRQHRGRFWWNMRQSCLCHLIFSTLNTLFPIFTSFGNYSLPGDLLTDLLAGFTMAVMHIPQGMAYGMLSGVEPIYGLYVSFIPVAIMAFMSKSYHVSYGTFAVTSMLLVNSLESTKSLLKHQLSIGVANNASELLRNSVSSELGALILTNNHQADDPAKKMLRNLLIPQDSETPSKLDSDFPYESNLTVSSRAAATDSFGQTLSMFMGGVDGTLSGTGFVMPTNIEILTCICLVTGLIQIVLSLARLGILSLMFSDQLVSGFTTASAINVVTSQIAGLFDLTLPSVPEGLFKIFRVWWVFGWRLSEGFNQYTGMLSLFSFVFLLSIKEIIEPLLKRRFRSLTCLPSELLLMVMLIFASWYWQFESVYGIHIVGNVPTGLPVPTVPRLDLAPLVIEDAFTVALVSFAMNFSLASVYARRYKYKLDPNQELLAVGTSNLVSSFFSCFPSASSLSRTAIKSSLNVKSQVCSLFSSSIVLLIVCYFAPILHDLPRAVLSCIIIVALKGILIQIKDLYLNWRLSKLDALVWIITFLSVLVFGITYGLVVGIIASLFMIFFRLLTPNHSILGQLPNTEIYVDTDVFMDCQEVDQVKIYRFNSALCYLNRTMFKTSVEKSLPEIYQKSRGVGMFCSKKSANTESTSRKIKHLIIDCSALAYCDYSGAATLVDIVEELDMHDLTVFLVACPLKLINMLEKMQSVTILERNVYPTITDAINYVKYLRRRNSKTLSNATVNDSCSHSLNSCLP